MTPRRAVVLVVVAILFIGATQAFAADAAGSASSAAATTKQPSPGLVSPWLSQVLTAINPVFGLIPPWPGLTSDFMKQDEPDPDGGHLPGPDPYPGGIWVLKPPGDGTYPGELPKP